MEITPIPCLTDNYAYIIYDNNSKTTGVVDPSEAQPIIGEILETSGHGGIFPSGVNVGKIISKSNGNYYVQPLPNPQKLRFVSIISNVNQEKIKKSEGFAPLQENQNKINLKGFNKFSN